MAKEYQFNYTICKQPDADLFYRQCAAIESNIPDLDKDKLLEDVDGTLIQTYKHSRGAIKVCNDYYVGCLYVDSDFDLLPYFG